MEDADFRRGAIDIQWLERKLPTILATKPPRETIRVAAIAAALLAERQRVAPQRATADRANGQLEDDWTRVARLEALR